MKYTPLARLRQVILPFARGIPFDWDDVVGALSTFIQELLDEQAAIKDEKIERLKDEILQLQTKLTNLQ
jgi:hypothetical protein